MRGGARPGSTPSPVVLLYVRSDGTRLTACSSVHARTAATCRQPVASGSHAGRSFPSRAGRPRKDAHTLHGPRRVVPVRIRICRAASDAGVGRYLCRARSGVPRALRCERVLPVFRSGPRDATGTNTSQQLRGPAAPRDRPLVGGGPARRRFPSPISAEPRRFCGGRISRPA